MTLRALIGSLIALFGVCANAQEKDEVVLRILYFREIEGAPEMWEMHTGYVRYQDMSEPSITASAPLSEEDQKRLQDAFDAVRLDSLEKSYEGAETKNAPGLMFQFYPDTDKEKAVKLRAFRHEALLHLLQVIDELSAFPCDYLDDLKEREKSKE